MPRPCSQSRLRDLLADDLAVPDKLNLLQAIPSAAVLAYLAVDGGGGGANTLLNVALLRSMLALVALLDDERARLRLLLCSSPDASPSADHARLAHFLHPPPSPASASKVWVPSSVFKHFISTGVPRS